MREKGEHMAFNEEEEGKLRAIIAIFDGQAPSLSSDVAAKCPALFAEWDGDGHAYAEGERALMKSELFRLHAEYVQTGKPVPLDIKEQANSVHEVYAGLGGNGVGTHLWQELMDAHASD